MGELLTGAEALLGLGGGPLVDTHTDEHQTYTDIGVDINNDHEINSHNISYDDHSVHQTIIQQTSSSSSSSGGGGGGGGGGHHAHFDPEVYEMQKHLQEEGFNPGQLDGLMGPQTQHALMEDEQYEMHQHQHHHPQHNEETYGDDSSYSDTSYSMQHHEHHEHHEYHQGHVAPPEDEQPADENY